MEKKKIELPRTVANYLRTCESLSTHSGSDLYLQISNRNAKGGETVEIDVSRENALKKGDDVHCENIFGKIEKAKSRKATNRPGFTWQRLTVRVMYNRKFEADFKYLESTL